MAMRIGEVARRAGIGESTLRAWERRFGLLRPERTAGRQRLYTDDDLARVCAVRRLVDDGLTLQAAVARVMSDGVADIGPDEDDPIALRQIVDAAGDGIWVARAGRSSFVNRRMAELMHCSVDDLLGRPITDFVDPEWVPLLRAWAAGEGARRRQRYEYELRRLDGTSFHAELTTSPLQDRTGAHEGWVGVVRDITARVEAEKEARFRSALLDSVGDAVAAARPDGTIVYVNPAAERLLGWRASEVIGRNGIELFPASSAAEEAHLIHNRLLEGRHWSGSVRMTRRDGSQFVAKITSSPVFGEDHTVIGTIGVFSDLTEATALGEESRRRELQLETLALLGVHALRRSLPGFAAVTAEALEAVRRVLSLDYAALMEANRDGSEFIVRMSAPPVEHKHAVPAGSRSLAGYTALARRVVVVTDAAKDRRFDRCASSDVPSAAAIAAPVFGPAGVRAVLLAETRNQTRFDEAAEQFMQGMANVIGALLADEVGDRRRARPDP